MKYIDLNGLFEEPEFSEQPRIYSIVDDGEREYPQNAEAAEEDEEDEDEDDDDSDSEDDDEEEKKDDNGLDLDGEEVPDDATEGSGGSAFLFL